MRILAKTGRRYFLSQDEDERKDDGDTSFSPSLFFFFSLFLFFSLSILIFDGNDKKESTHHPPQKTKKLHTEGEEGAGALTALNFTTHIFLCLYSFFFLLLS
jgi:hypothetical protein